MIAIIWLVKSTVSIEFLSERDQLEATHVSICLCSFTKKVLIVPVHQTNQKHKPKILCQFEWETLKNVHIAWTDNQCSNRSKQCKLIQTKLKIDVHWGWWVQYHHKWYCRCATSNVHLKWSFQCTRAILYLHHKLLCTWKWQMTFMESHYLADKTCRNMYGKLYK